eukprot:scaffold6178_cov143-Skeletonema_menzelii.AAC.13
MNNNNNNNNIRSLALLLATVGSSGGSSSFADSEENHSHQIVVRVGHKGRRSFILEENEEWSGQDGEGKKCVHDALKKLEHDKTTRVKYEEVLAIMETELYNKAASSCKDERSNNMIKWVDSNYTEMPATYAEFWGGPAHYGYVYYDGALDLATMFEYTQNFTVFGSDVPCLADCYFGGDGCTYLENWLPFAGAISKEQYCSQKWSKIDYAYGALRVCAAKAIADPADGTTKEAYVEHNQANQNSSNTCAYEIWVNDCKPLKVPPQ